MGIIWSWLSTEWRKWTATAEASAGVPVFDSLPAELLETIFGFLDGGTLCTARLVCTEFRGAASRCIYSVKLPIGDLRSRPETNLKNFPNLSRVSVSGVEDDDLLMLARSPLAHAVTHVWAAKYLRQLPRRVQIAKGSRRQRLPNLTSLTVSFGANRPFPFPQTLRELTLDGSVTRRTANFVARLTNLTCLRIDICNMSRPFEGLRALTALQRLEICCQVPSIAFVGELTLLTHLHVDEMGMGIWSSDWARVSLTRLNKLVHLGVGRLDARSEAEVVASIGTLTSLRSLHLHLCGQPAQSAFDTVCMTPFSQLTALRLKIYRGSCSDASFLLRFNLERLQDLSLKGVELDRVGVAALRRATGLTNLELWTMRGGASMGPGELGQALSRMPRLRALSLDTGDAFPARSCSRIIGRLTELTKLSLCGPRVTTNAAARVCLGLKKLRVLRMTCPSFVWADCSWVAPAERITRETVFALAKLPELRMLEISGKAKPLRWDLTDNCRARLNTGRHDKGWPPLKVDLSWYCNCES